MQSISDKRRIVEVEWEDAATTHGWQTEEDLPSTSMVRSVGIVHSDDERQLVLLFGEAAPKNRHDLRTFDDAIAIPKSQIRHVRELRPKR